MGSFGTPEGGLAGYFAHRGLARFSNLFYMFISAIHLADGLHIGHIGIINQNICQLLRTFFMWGLSGPPSGVLLSLLSQVSHKVLNRTI